MPNTNNLEGIQCSRCGNEELFWITGTTAFLVSDDGTEEHGDVEWSDESPCRCDECGKAGKLEDFKAHDHCCEMSKFRCRRCNAECADCHDINEQFEEGAGYCPTCNRPTRITHQECGCPILGPHRAGCPAGEGR